MRRRLDEATTPMRLLLDEVTTPVGKIVLVSDESGAL